MNRADAITLLHDVTAILAGKKPDHMGITAELGRRLGIRLLALCQANFLDKAQGGGGADGVPWKPLAPSTIARRQVTAADRRMLDNRTKKLTPAQEKRYQREYRTRLSKLITSGVARDKAIGLARAGAYGVLRKSGADIPKRLTLLAGRQVLSLIDTGALFASLTPPSEVGSVPGQVFEVKAGAVTVGTTVHAWHHFGGGRLPRREFWPDPLPNAWIAELLGVAKDYLREIVPRLLQLRP